MKERILVVDDNRDFADSLAMLLQALGHDARAVYDGRAAIDEAAIYLPDMVLIDIVMPGFDGYQTVKKIRAYRECAHAILVALTSFTTREDKHHAYAAGFDLHVAKPMSIETLKQILKLLNPTEAESTSELIRRLNVVWRDGKAG